MIADRLRCTRFFRGKTLQQVSDDTGIQLRSYQRYEGGQCEPPLSNLVILADYFRVPTDFLLGRDDYLRSLGVSVDVPLKNLPRHPNGGKHR